MPLHCFSKVRTNLRPLVRWEPDFLKLFLRLVLPMALQSLVGSTLHIVDGVMVSVLGDAPYAGVVQANRITFIVQLFIFGASSGAAIFCSQFWGKGDVEGMRRVQGMTMRLTCGIGLLFLVAVLCAPRVALGLFLQPGESFEYGLQYMMIILPLYLLNAVDAVFAMMLRSSGRAAIPMTAAISAVVTNTCLNYAMIGGHWGFPPLGVRGAAYATVIATVVSLSINVGTSYVRKLAPAIRPRDFRLPERAFRRRFWKTIIPVVCNEGFWSIGVTMYSVVYSRMANADVVLAAVNLAGTVDQLIFVLGFGIMNATSVIVGNSIGAQREEEAYLYAKRMLFVAASAMLVMGAVLLLIRGTLVAQFQLSGEARAMALDILFIAAFFLSIRAFNAVNVVGVLRAGGDTVFSMLLDVGALWLVGVPLVAVCGLVLGWPARFVYLATCVEEGIKVLIGLPRFLSRKWLRNLVHDASM